MNLLVVYENKEIRELVSFFLEGKFHISVQEAHSIDQAFALLDDDQQAFDGLVCDYPASGKKLLSHALAKGIDIHFFFNTPSLPDDPMVQKRRSWVHFFPSSSIIEGLEKQVKSVFKELQNETAHNLVEFCGIKLNLLLYASPLKAPLHVKLSDLKYVRIMKEGVEFDMLDYEYFVRRKKIEILFADRRFCKDIALQIESHIRNKDVNIKNPLAEQQNASLEAKKQRVEYLKARIRALEQQKGEVIDLKQQQSAIPENVQLPDDPEMEKRATMIQAKAMEILDQRKKHQELVAMENARRAQELERKKEAEEKKAALAKHLEKELGSDLETLSQMSNRLGFSKEVQEFTKQSVMSTIQTIRKTPKLSALMVHLRKEKEKYIFSHSMLLSYVSCALASQMEWKSDTTFQKLTLASFLHDMSLKNHDLAEIQTLSELSKRFSDFAPDEVKAFKDHPTVGAELVRRFSEIPPDVDLIIALHHERPDGSGFPRGLTHTRITALATVFIVAHDLVSFLFRSDQNDLSGVDINQFLEANHQTYQFGNFRKVLAMVPKISG